MAKNFGIYRRKIAFGLFFLSFYYLPAQDSTYHLLAEIPIAATYLTTDNLQQIYVTTPENEIIKYSPEGKILFRYNNFTLGDIAHIDASNPLNLLVYYSDYKTLINLDRTLNKSGEYNLLNLDVIDVNAIGRSSDNNIWLYDNTTFKLKKINRKGQVQLESDDLSLLLQKSLQPNFILEAENHVYINDPQQGILIFDLYGQYIKSLDIKGLNDFQIINNQLIYTQNEQLQVFHLKTLLENSIKLPKIIEIGDQLKIQQNKLFWKEATAVKVYQF